MVKANSAGVLHPSWECGRASLESARQHSEGNARLGQQGEQRLVQQFIQRPAVDTSHRVRDFRCFYLVMQQERAYRRFNKTCKLSRAVICHSAANTDSED